MTSVNLFSDLIILINRFRSYLTEQYAQVVNYRINYLKKQAHVYSVFSLSPSKVNPEVTIRNRTSQPGG